MSFPNIAQTAVNIAVSSLMPLFLPGTGDDLTAARALALTMLAAYAPENEEELNIAAEIVCLRMHILACYADASGTDTTLQDRIRLRNAGVRLGRQAMSLRKTLDAMRAARRVEAEPAPAAEISPQQAAELAEIARMAVAAITTKPAGQTWTQAYQQRQRDAALAKMAAKHRAVTGDRRSAAASLSRPDGAGPEFPDTAPALAQVKPEIVTKPGGSLPDETRVGRQSR
jgi:hypothetical protein